MSVLFADTFFFLALINKRDEAHERATRYSGNRRQLITTAWILTETADALSDPQNRPAFLRLLEILENSADVKILGPEMTLFRAGLELFRSRPDKEWSLTDCISFAAMKEHLVTEALTGDHHFEQAGFAALLKE